MSLPEIIVLLGAPASGKGTVAAHLAKTLHYEHVSTGELLRAKAEDDPALAAKLKAGELIDDDTVFSLLPDGSMILDGFPRTEEQVRRLSSTRDLISSDNIVFFRLDVDYQTALERMSKRAGEEHRADDNLVAFERRYTTYETNIGKILRGMDDCGYTCHIIDANTGTAQDHANRILETLGYVNPWPSSAQELGAAHQQKREKGGGQV